MLRAHLFAGALATCFAGAAIATPCRHALVMALDVSGSVNDVEFDQQVTGLARALNDPDVRNLILEGSGAPVALAVFEWSSRNHQTMIQPWTVIDQPLTLDGVIARVAGHRKQRAGLKTALGTALEFAAELLADGPSCWRQTIDVSGDGMNNIGSPPSVVYQSSAFASVTVNALVVSPSLADHEKVGTGPTEDELLNYFRREVIHGADAFALVAEGYVDYARAMRMKLLRELSVPEMGNLDLRRKEPPA